MSKCGEISSLLATSPGLNEKIQGHCSNLKQLFDSKQPFSNEMSYGNLESDLKAITEYVMNLSKLSMLQLNEWSETLAKIDADVDEAVGLMQRVRAGAGSDLVAPVLCGGGNVTPDDYVEVCQGQVPLLSFPPEPFDINMQALDNIGHSIEEVERGEANLPPLIKKIPDGCAPPNFWSNTHDFFLPGIAVMASMPDSRYTTSFSEFYGFDPVPAIVKAERQIQKQVAQSRQQQAQAQQQKAPQTNK